MKLIHKENYVVIEYDHYSQKRFECPVSVYVVLNIQLP
jgi:hypothetical protein